jgi:ABC-type glutathione transport system ATPase component
MSNEVSPALRPADRVLDHGLLTAAHVSKTYARRGRLGLRRHPGVAALRDVSLSIAPRQTLGIVGASGAGKSTLARCLACLETPDAGQILMLGQNLLELRQAELRRARRQIQLIFQGSAATFNPRFSAIDIVTEPLAVAGKGGKRERRERGLALMESVGLPREAAGRNCMEFSGGERQRLAIARALSLSPKVLILDESLSGLDLSVQAQIVNLLAGLQDRLAVSYIVISHDLRLAAHMSDHLAVMQSGSVVEHGPAAHVSRHPQHPYTRALLSAVVRFPPDT